MEWRGRPQPSLTADLHSKMATPCSQPKETECPVCMDYFTKPKILPCGHLLCQGCVIQWMDSNPPAGCPTCRYPITEPQENLHQNSAVVANALPTDYVMKALVECSVVLSKPRICCACDGVKAVSICMQCQDMMCSSCAEIHKKMSISRSHDVESLSTVTPERLAYSCPALCADHGDQQFLYCVQHNLALCPSCNILQHTECTELKNLQDQVKSAARYLNDVINAISEAEHKLEQAIDHVDSNLQKVNVDEEEDMAQLDTIFDHLTNVMEVCRNKLKDRTCGEHSRVKSSLRDNKTILESRLGILKSHTHLATRARQVAVGPVLIAASKALTHRVNSLDLTVNLNEHLVESPVPTAVRCKEVIMGIEEELQMLGDQMSKPLSIASSTLDIGLMAPRDQPSSSYHTRATRPALLLQNTSGPVEATPAMLQHPASHDDHISDSSGDRERRTRPFRIRSGQRASITGGPFRAGSTGTVTYTRKRKAKVQMDNSGTTITVCKV
ncbi:E3 ubiquitin-protein ligase Midline-1-like isoform X1 [Pomacea canaliculata]|uniref:E3 ubiquitin-protein ligase Midline-1-like isoform X1 n=2 Tax=Pomacea canaliculata TaxID=400727 RepID=UPI000D730162|nr:E3 ubiquitin-protein ligase Midline-1-like isoform X1 [Pomacea canaliculata]XP_025113269.1 E3 ubiquitin-protein ligase Midline-1-like isoform X1 [Pomacea canaliculata]